MNKRGKRLNLKKIDIPEYGLGSWMKKGVDTINDVGKFTVDSTLSTIPGLGNVVKDSDYSTGLGKLGAKVTNLISDASMFGADTSLGGMGMTGVVGEEDYQSGYAKKLNQASDKYSPMGGKIVGGIVGGYFGGPAGAAAGYQGMGELQKGLGSATGVSEEQLAAKEAAKNAEIIRNYNNAVSGLNPKDQTNIPTFRNGGIINYKGQTHDGPNGGIPVDNNGNPAIQSGNQPTGLTEDKEVAWNLPDGNTFIFSDSLGYAPIAKRIYSKYSKRLGKNMEKTDPISMKGLTQEFNDLAAEQEISKSMNYGNASSSEELPKMGKGGHLDNPMYATGGLMKEGDPVTNTTSKVPTRNISGVEMKYIESPREVVAKYGKSEDRIDDPTTWVSEAARLKAKERYLHPIIQKDYEKLYPEAVGKYKEFVKTNPNYSQEELDALVVQNKDIFNKAVLDKAYAKKTLGKDLLPAYESLYNKKTNVGSGEIGTSPTEDRFGIRHYAQKLEQFTPYEEYVTSGAQTNVDRPESLVNSIRGYRLKNIEYEPGKYKYKVETGRIPAGYQGFQGGTGIGEIFKDAKEVEYEQQLNDNSDNKYNCGGMMKKYDDGGMYTPIKPRQGLVTINSQQLDMNPNVINTGAMQKTQSEPEMYRGDNTMDYIGTGLSMFGNTMQMLGNKRPAPIRLGRITPRTVDLSGVRAAMQDEARNTKINLMRGLPMDAAYRANALKGISDISEGVNKGILSSQTQEAMTNAEIRNQAAAQNAELQSQETLINAQRGEGYQNTQNAYKKAIMQAPIDALSRTSSRANMWDMAQLNENYDIVKNPNTGRIQFIPKKK